MEPQILMIREVASQQESCNFAADAVAFFDLNDTILLYGTLGSGKTFLVKEFTRLLGSAQEAYSPSFTIVNQYAGRVLINHIDLFRIRDRREIENLGLEDFWEGGYINFIEWPDMIEHAITWPHFRITIEVNFPLKFWRRFRLSKYGG
jgi:tRNA threonylcarbamoyladenosine biosynthesis protein TsaE